MRVLRKFAEWTGYATFLVLGLAMLVVTLDSDQEETQAKSETKPAPVETAMLGPDEPPEPVPVETATLGPDDPPEPVPVETPTLGPDEPPEPVPVETATLGPDDPPEPVPVETATLGPDEPPEPVPVEASAPTVQPTVNVEELSCPEPVKVNLDYAKAVPVRQIASDIVNQWGLKVGALVVLPKGKSRDFFWTDSTESALTVLARGDDWTWYRNGDTVRFVKRDDPVLTTTAKLIATKFKIETVPTGDGLMVTVDSDLADMQQIKVSVRRTFLESGSTETYAGDYFNKCGLAAQWRVPKFIPIDDETWKARLIALQDKMAVLGEPGAFDIGEISDNIQIDARSRFNDAEVAVLLPLTVKVRSKSNLVGPYELVLGESYELLAGAHIIPRLSSSSERGRRLDAGEIIRVDGIETIRNNPSYLVSVGNRTGWVNSITLIPKGVRRVSTLTDQERKVAELRQILMDKVFGPCIEYAYLKLSKDSNISESDARMAMHESVQPHLDDIVSELMGMSLDLLPESEIEKFYRDSLNNCKEGAARP